MKYVLISEGVSELIALFDITKGQINILDTHKQAPEALWVIVDQLNRGIRNKNVMSRWSLIPMTDSTVKLPAKIDCSRMASKSSPRAITMKQGLAKRQKKVKEVKKFTDIPSKFWLTEYGFRSVGRRQWKTTQKDLYSKHQIEVTLDNLKKLYSDYLKSRS